MSLPKVLRCARPVFALTAVLLCTAAVGAQPLVVTSGALDMKPSSGPLVLGGARGFSFIGNVGITGGLFEPVECNFDPLSCVAGSTLSLDAHWDGGDAGGTATLEGVRYQLGGFDSPNSLLVDFAGALVLPPIAPSATVTAPFTLSGTFTHAASGQPVAQEPLSGSGTAILYLSADLFFPGSWHVDRAIYLFGDVLPGTWLSTDVGDVGRAGAGTVSGDTFVVSGAGSDIWGSADSFHFVYKPIGDATELIARVDGQQFTHPFAKAGIMMRGSVAPSAASVILAVRPGGGLEFMVRSSAGQNTTFIAGGTAAYPVWLRLVRSGGTVTASTSADGVQWSSIGSTTLSGDLLGGLAVTSINRAVLNEAMFGSVRVSTGTAALPRPWSVTQVGPSTVVTGAHYQLGQFDVRGAGADIWGTSDGFTFVNQAFADKGQIVSRIISLQNTHAFAKAGLMIRSGLGAGAAHVILDVRPNGAVEFMTRAATGGATTYIGGATATFPVWLKLDRDGGRIAGAISPDGVNWTVVGSAPLAASSSDRAGLVVTSISAGPALARFEHVGVAIERPGQLPTPWASEDVGAVGATGAAAYADGVFTLEGAGADIWGAADEFRFAYRTVGTDTAFVARVSMLEHTSPFAKAGLMVRSTLSASAAHVVLDVRPTGDVEFMSRAAGGSGHTSYLAGDARGIPVWLKLTVSGSTVSGWTSADGATWRLVGSATPGFPMTNAYAGLVVASVSDPALATARIDAVSP